MFHIWWPATAAFAVIVMMTILIILMYGDKICRRVQSQTKTLQARVARGPPSPRASTSRLQMEQEEESHQLPPTARHYQQPQQTRHYYDDPPEIEQYEEREVVGVGGAVGGFELQQQYNPKKTFSREAEV